MFRKKLTSIITSAVMCLSMVNGVISASAEESENKIYTLQELWDMSDKEFLNLRDAEDNYGLVKNDCKFFGGITGKIELLNFLDCYNANVDDIKVKEILGDTVKYEISSPIYMNPDDIKLDGSKEYYKACFGVIFPDYDFPSEIPSENNEQIMEFTKCLYCLKQILDVHAETYGLTSNDECVLKHGDVNFDLKVNYEDLYYMKRGLTGKINLTDAQKKMADINKDGKFDDLDITAFLERPMYTLNEVLDMSKEEFFAAFPGTEEKFLDYSESSSYSFSCRVDNYSYLANYTETKLEELLKDSFEYTMTSPIYSSVSNNHVYPNIDFTIKFSGLSMNNDNGDALTHLKIKSCLEQVLLDNLTSRTNCTGSWLDIGDVNMDGEINDIDIDYMEKGLSGELNLTDAQKVVADVNEDGEFNDLDIEFLNNQLSNDEYIVPEDVEPSKYGDITCSGSVDVADLVKLNLYLTNSEKYSLTDVQKANADCFKDGVIDAKDCTTIMNYVSMMIDEDELGK